VKLDELLEARMREIALEVKTPPAFVHQRNVEAVVGVPRRQFLQDAKARQFPTTKQRRLVFARTADVVAFYELRLRVQASPVANDADAEAIALARVGARRVAR
jgi:hypothetical protein